MKERTMLEKIQRTAQRIYACGSNGRKAYPLGTPFDFIRQDYEGASAPSVPAGETEETPTVSEFVPKHRGGGIWDAQNVATGEINELGLGSKTETQKFIDKQKVMMEEEAKKTVEQDKKDK